MATKCLAAIVASIFVLCTPNGHCRSLTFRSQSDDDERDRPGSYDVFDDEVRGLSENQLKTKSLCSPTCKYCDCSSKGLTSIPSYLSEDVVVLNMYNNSVSELANNSLVRFPRLEKLFLARNNLSRLHERSFSGLVSLQHLSLVNNRIAMTEHSIPVGVFLPLQKLTKLSMERNNQNSTDPGLDYPHLALSVLGQLVNLSMDGLRNKTFGPGFSNMTSLRHLSIAGFVTGYCKLDVLREDTFIHLSSLHSLNMSDCFIQGSEVHHLTFTPLQNLKTLDLTFNEDFGLETFSQAVCALKNSSLTWLLINNIVSRFSLALRINRSHVDCLPTGLLALEATGNSIEIVDPSVFSALPQGLQLLNVGDNKFVFEHYLQYLWQLKSLKKLMLDGGSYLHNIPSKYPFSAVPHQHSLLQADQYSRDVIHVAQRPSQRGDLESSRECITFRLPPELEELEMSKASLKYNLSPIKFDKRNKLHTLKLDKNYFPSAVGPFEGLEKLAGLDLSRTNLACIKDSFFQNFPFLRRLNLGENRLNSTPDCLLKMSTFSNLSRLTHLHLDDNGLYHIRPDLFLGLHSLVSLKLNNNPFWIFETRIDHMAQLRELDLHLTAVRSLSPDMRRQIDSLKNVSVNMASAPILCECNNLKFLEWMTSSPAFNKTFEGYKCAFDGTKDRNITDGFQQILRNLQRECPKHIAIFFIILAASLLTTLIVVAVLLYRFRWKLRFLYYVAYQRYWDRCPQAEPGAFQYDVFLSYAFEDEQFVLNDLNPALSSLGLRVLIHGRDFRAGEYIASNIVTAVKTSRRTLVVLTAAQVKSNWCTYELQMANVESAYSGRPVLVFLIMEKIRRSRVGIELASHISTNTYIAFPPTAHRTNDQLMKAFYDRLANDLRG
ncbi:toll-like receptor 4 [Aplysia californica]|uniref:Toll-like receptor 4 n=1 Tax=Aplysia californica TaxID=6500 RepID=A0ABM0K754_APLCA|nr:toll-like receptor 4 [Aplysia californica]